MSKKSVILLTLSLIYVCNKATSQIVISEVYFNTYYSEDISKPCNHRGEFIELYNYSGKSVNLNRWKLMDHKRLYRFTDDIIIPPGGFLLIAYGKKNDPCANTIYTLFPQIKTLMQNSPELYQVYFQETIVLNNERERLKLYDYKWSTISSTGQFSQKLLKIGNGNIGTRAAGKVQYSAGLNAEKFYSSKDKSDRKYEKQKASPFVFSSQDTGGGNQNTNQKKNIVINQYIQKANVTELNTLSSLNKTSELHEIIDIKNALYKSEQVILKNFGGNGTNLVSITTFERGKPKAGYLPFIAGNSIDGKEINELISMQKDFYKQLKNENFGFSELSYYESINPGIQRISEPGESNKATKYNRLATDVNIPLLKVKDGQNSWSNRFSFAKNKEGIYYDEKVNAQGYTERNYYDHNGNLILKRQIPDGEKTNTRDIIKVYDSKDRLRHILVPSESKKVADGNFSSNHNLIYEKNYHFDYDKDGKLISKYTPGKGLEEYVYDVWGRLILMQNEKEKSGNIWRYIKYDHLNRPIYHGRITSSSSPQTLRNRFNTNEQTANQHGHSRFEERTLSSNGIGYTTNKSFPNQISESHIDVIYFYDTYQIPHVSANVYNFKAVNTAHFSVPSIYPRASSRLTATYTKEIGASKWMKTIIYYDGKGRVLQTVADNHLGGTDRKTMVYDDFKELVTAQHHEHRSPGYTIDFTYLYEYDHRNRLSNVKHKTGNNPLVTLASNTYNNLGELERQSFHQVGGGQFLQSNTYKYDIAGRLLEVNNVNDMKDNYFAQRYTYNKNVPGGNSYKRYDGLISSITWKNIFDKQAYSYNFKYTAHNMLSEAQSNAALASNEKITYDIDGNIASLERAVKGLSKMQRYTYEYDNKGSLEKILDSSDRSAGAAVKTYSYDAIGNVSNDAGSIGSIQYNHLNLPDRISNENQTLHFKYSTLGHKLSMSTTDGQLTYDYVGEITYLNGYPLYISTPFGRILLIDEKPEYQYFIKDHLGNNRLTYTAEKHVEHYSATMEERQREQEEEVWKFTNIGNKRVPVSALLNATPSAQADATPKVIRLNAARGATDGLQKSLQVFPGDKVRASVKVKYFDASIFGTQAHLALNVLMGSSPMPAEGFDPNETHGNGGMASLPEPPKAYLNFVLVDKDDRILKIWDRRVSKEAAISPDALDKDHEELVIEEQMESAGYLLIFLSHVEASENIDLFFDDMHITHTYGPLVQYNDYFPFGMVNPAQSYLRERTLPNRYGFNGTESLESLGVKLNQTYFRLYDPQFARWMGVDPVDFHAYNGYHFSFNNPINFSDFWGDCPWRDIDDRKCGELTEEEWDAITMMEVEVNGCRDCWDDFMDIAIDLEIGNEWYGDDESERSSSSDFTLLTIAAANVNIFGGVTAIAVNQGRPRYTGPNEWARQVKAGTKFGKGLGYLGLILTASDMAINGVNTSNTLDAAFGVISLAGVPGAAVGGTYFMGNMITYGATGQTIGEHIDNYHWMPIPGGGYIPIAKIR